MTPLGNISPFYNNERLTYAYSKPQEKLMAIHIVSLGVCADNNYCLSLRSTVTPLSGVTSTALITNYLSCSSHSTNVFTPINQPPASRQRREPARVRWGRHPASGRDQRGTVDRETLLGLRISGLIVAAAAAENRRSIVFLCVALGTVVLETTCDTPRDDWFGVRKKRKRLIAGFEKN